MFWRFQQAEHANYNGMLHVFPEMLAKKPSFVLE